MGSTRRAAPYKIVNNDYSLLDVSDVVFIDAPGTGFSRIMGKDKEKAFYGVDQDAHAFDRFIRRFLTKYDRWNSPKYLFGESYGTPRSAVLSAVLENVDLNGIILLSQILSFDNSIDGPKWNPGDGPGVRAGAADVCGDGVLSPQAADAAGGAGAVSGRGGAVCGGRLYESRCCRGANCQTAQEAGGRRRSCTDIRGCRWRYLLRANLRVIGAAFSKELQLDEETTTGRLDSRYKGPDLDPLSADADYDPQSNAISSAYTAAMNQYLRDGAEVWRADQTYKPGAYGEPDFTLGPAASGCRADLRRTQQSGGTNVMPDLAYTMKSNPKMKVMLAGGYYDLATPFFEGMYEMHHLPIPQKLQANISYHYYQSGHMVYVNEDVLKQFHADVAAFIRGTENGK